MPSSGRDLFALRTDPAPVTYIRSRWRWEQVFVELKHPELERDLWNYKRAPAKRGGFTGERRDLTL